MTKQSLSLLEPTEISQNYSSEKEIVLRASSVLDFLKDIPRDSLSLIITSPPYNIGKEYETEVSLSKYLQQQEQVIEQLVTKLKPDGSICWEVGNYVNDGEIFPLDIYFYEIFKRMGLKLRNRIIWHFGHGLHASKRFSGRYETILWFTKSDDYKFNLDSVRIPSKYPGKRHYKGPNKGKPSGNPLGKNPSDLWKFVAQEWDKELWNIPNVKSNHPEKTGHPCQFPIELIERCVLALTDEGDWVFDPYVGVGSSIIAALRHSRKAIGCDKEETYIEIAKERIELFYNGELKIRPMQKPIYQPTGREKTSQKPKEWKEESKKRSLL